MMTMMMILQANNKLNRRDYTTGTTAF